MDAALASQLYLDDDLYWQALDEFNLLRLTLFGRPRLPFWPIPSSMRDSPLSYSWRETLRAARLLARRPPRHDAWPWFRLDGISEIHGDLPAVGWVLHYSPRGERGLLFLGPAQTAFERSFRSGSYWSLQPRYVWKPWLRDSVDGPRPVAPAADEASPAVAGTGDAAPAAATTLF